MRTPHLFRGSRFRKRITWNCSSDLPMAELLKRFYPKVPVRKELGEFEALLSNRKVREVLGFQEQHNWRKYVPASGAAVSNMGARQ